MSQQQGAVVVDSPILNDTDLINPHINATLENIIEHVVSERNYNILLWTPFIAIPVIIIITRLVKYIYKIYQAKMYGYGDDLFDDPLAQLGLAQLGLKLNRDYDDTSDIRKIRKEQKKLEQRINRRKQKATNPKSNNKNKQQGRGSSSSSTNNNDKKEDTSTTTGYISAFVAKPFFLAENYLMGLRQTTERTWSHHLSPDAVRRWFNNSRFCRIWMIFQVMCTVVAIINYVLLTYSIQRADRLVIKDLDVALAFIFLADYSISMYIAEDRLAFYFNPSSIVDLMSIVPPIVYFFVSESSQYVWFLGLLRILRASRILRTYRLLSFSESEEKRELTIVALSFCNFIFLSASVINALETINVERKTDPSLTTWHDSLYYIMVTFSTIGFGDLTPSSVPTRIFVMLLIIMVIVYVPIQTSRISEIYNSTSAYQRDKYSASSRHAHVILAGTITYSTVVDFCREFFAADSSSHVVILATVDPNIEMRRLLRHPFYRNRVHYLTGSGLSIPDLKRASASHSTALFLVNVPTESLNSSPSTIEDEEIRVTRGADASTLMQALVTKKSFPGLPILAQVQDIRSEDLSTHCGCDRVLCLDAIKMSILARDCLVPGFLALVLNLVSTYKEGVVQSADDKDAFWMQEYSSGASNQVFSFRIPPGLARTKWADAVEVVYRAFGVTLFAVQSSYGPQSGKLRLNPGKDYYLRDEDVVFCMANAGDEIILRICIQFKDPIPRAQLEMMELEAQMDAKLPMAPRSAPVTNSADMLDGSQQFETSNTSLHPTSKPLASTSQQSLKALSTTPSPSILTDHIILCGHTTARGIRHFVTGIRKAEGRYNDFKHTYGGIAFQKRVPIVILLEIVPEDAAERDFDTPNQPGAAKTDGGIWADIVRDPDVYILKGTPLKKTSLMRAGVGQCRRIVVFAANQSGPGESGNGEQNHVLLDANAIFIVKMIQEEWPYTDFVVELLSGTNVRYFAPTRRSSTDWDTTNLRMQSILNNYSLSIGDRVNLYKKIRQHGADEETFLRQLWTFMWSSDGSGTSVTSPTGGAAGGRGSVVKKQRSFFGMQSQVSLVVVDGSGQDKDGGEVGDKVSLTKNAAGVGYISVTTDDVDGEGDDNVAIVPDPAINTGGARESTVEKSRASKPPAISTSLSKAKLEVPKKPSDMSFSLDTKQDSTSEFITPTPQNEPADKLKDTVEELMPTIEDLDDLATTPTGKSSAPISTAYLQKLVTEAEMNESGFSPFPVYHFDRNFAMGRVAPMSFIHSLLAQAYFRPFLVDVVKGLAGSVIQIEIPKRFHGKRYSDLMRYLLAKDLLPLGLYRNALKWRRSMGAAKVGTPSSATFSSNLNPNAASGNNGYDNLPLPLKSPLAGVPGLHGRLRASSVTSEGLGRMPYVYTNCKGFDILDKDDLVFALTSHDE
ncbi:hypothetical protein HDV05_003473 [Chytridiales sp. JEL 0842]|nr:hypothetical protein HDV05_003473 [Chytridiales sp. JEL 0842]